MNRLEIIKGVDVLMDEKNIKTEVRDDKNKWTEIDPKDLDS